MARRGRRTRFLDPRWREWPPLASRDGGCAGPRAPVFAAPALQALAVRRAVRAVADHAVFGRGEQLRRRCGCERPAGKEATLPGGVRAEARHEALVLRSSGAPGQPPLEGEHSIRVPGVASAGGWRVEAQVVPMPVSLDAPPFVAYLDADALGGELCVRGRRQGDRFQPLGIGTGEQNLQDSS